MLTAALLFRVDLGKHTQITIYNYLEWRKILRTIKGNLVQLTTVTQDLKSNGKKSYLQKFKIDNTEIELVTQSSINAKNGDLVLVAGMDSYDNVFKAYSLKNLS